MSHDTPLQLPGSLSFWQTQSLDEVLAIRKAANALFRPPPHPGQIFLLTAGNSLGEVMPLIELGNKSFCKSLWHSCKTSAFPSLKWNVFGGFLHCFPLSGGLRFLAAYFQLRKNKWTSQLKKKPFFCPRLSTILGLRRGIPLHSRYQTVRSHKLHLYCLLNCPPPP